MGSPSAPIGTPPQRRFLYSPQRIAGVSSRDSVRRRFTSRRRPQMAKDHIGAAVARAAEWRDADQLSQTLARALFDDPLICFLQGERTAMTPRRFRARFRLALPYIALRRDGRLRGRRTLTAARPMAHPILSVRHQRPWTSISPNLRPRRHFAGDIHLKPHRE